MRFVSRFVATGFFTGYVPVAPGTAGSLVGAFLYWLIPGSDSPIFLSVILALFMVGAWASNQVERETSIKDHQSIVIDEIVGVFITLLLFEKKVIWLAIGFILFRLFDILKPPPARQLEALKDGWGVMMDDVIAGLYAALSLRLIYWVVTRLL